MILADKPIIELSRIAMRCGMKSTSRKYSRENRRIFREMQEMIVDEIKKRK